MSERVLPDGTVVDGLGNFVGIDQPAAHGQTLRLRADEVMPGDEILSGPQGPIPAAPTVLRIYWRSPDGVIVARLIDESGTSDALWTPSTSIKVWRRAGVILAALAVGSDDDSARDLSVTVLALEGGPS